MFVGALAGLIIAAVLTGICLANEGRPNEVECSKAEIVALVDCSQSKGRFFITSGSFGQEEVYRFYIKTPDGGKQFRSLPAERVTIFEEDRQDAYLSEIKEERQQPPLKKIERLFPLILPHDSLIETGRYAIHVPIGTIQTEKNFQIDME